jgi:hypothetical protein
MAASTRSSASSLHSADCSCPKSAGLLRDWYDGGAVALQPLNRRCLAANSHAVRHMGRTEVLDQGFTGLMLQFLKAGGLDRDR